MPFIATSFMGFLFVLFLVLYFLSSAIRILREYERGVVFRLGRIIPVKGPGLVIIFPVIDKLVKVSLRTVTMDVPSQDIITRDNITVKVNAVVYFRVMEPIKAITEVEDFYFATSQIAQTTLRSILGQSQLDDLLSKREESQRRASEGHRLSDRAMGDKGHGCRGQERRPADGDAQGDSKAGRGRA